MTKKKVVAISGGFDPIHIGHINLLKSAKALGHKLIVIINNDNWLKTKKGYSFLNQKERKVILEAVRFVDQVVITSHSQKTKDRSVCKELSIIKPDIFANGGDRKADNIPEYKLCQKLGIKMVFNVGGSKTQSSSNLVKKVRKLKKIKENF